MTPQEMIQGELRPGEQIVWAGQPVQGIRLQAADWFAIPFSLILGFGLALAAISLIGEGGLVKRLVATLFLVAGATMVFGRFFIDAKLRARRFYAVTNRRALSIVSLWRIQVDSVSLRRLTSCFVIVGGRGAGQIVFGSHNFSQVWPHAVGPQPASFERIPDAHRVFRLVVSAQRDLLNQAGRSESA